MPKLPIGTKRVLLPKNRSENRTGKKIEDPALKSRTSSKDVPITYTDIPDEWEDWYKKVGYLQPVLPGHKYRTLSGLQVRFNSFEADQVIGEVFDKKWVSCYWSNNGRYAKSNRPHPLDIVLLKDYEACIKSLRVIDIDKEYTLRNGKEVTITGIDRTGNLLPISGIVEGRKMNWTILGRHSAVDAHLAPFDLVLKYRPFRIGDSEGFMKFVRDGVCVQELTPDEVKEAIENLKSRL